jgi:hypothetical protein
MFNFFKVLFLFQKQDEDLYPEYYRKKQAGQKMSIPRPFNIGNVYIMTDCGVKEVKNINI